MRRRVSSTGRRRRLCERLGDGALAAAGRRACGCRRSPSSKRDVHAARLAPASASRRSTASWRSSISSKAKSTRSAIPPMISRTTALEVAGQRRVELDALAVLAHAAPAIVPSPTTRSPSSRQAQLARGHRLRRAARAPARARVAPPVAADAAGDRRASGSEASRRSTATAPRCRRGVLERHARGGERLARAHHHLVVRGVLRQHVERLGRATPSPRRWPDGELVLAVVAAEHGARRGRRSRRGAAGAGRRGGAGSRAPPRPATKQRSWLSRLSATGSPASRASARTASLVSPPSGKESRSRSAGSSRASM